MQNDVCTVTYSVALPRYITLFFGGNHMRITLCKQINLWNDMFVVFQAIIISEHKHLKLLSTRINKVCKKLIEGSKNC